MKRVKTLFSWTICELRVDEFAVRTTDRYIALPSFGRYPLEPETRFWGTKPDAGQLDGA
jgi:hypothetical protein